MICCGCCVPEVGISGAAVVSLHGDLLQASPLVAERQEADTAPPPRPRPPNCPFVLETARIIHSSYFYLASPV